MICQCICWIKITQHSHILAFSQPIHTRSHISKYSHESLTHLYTVTTHMDHLFRMADKSGSAYITMSLSFELARNARL